MCVLKNRSSYYETTQTFLIIKTLVSFARPRQRRDQNSYVLNCIFLLRTFQRSYTA